MSPHLGCQVMAHPTPGLRSPGLALDWEGMKTLVYVPLRIKEMVLTCKSPASGNSEEKHLSAKAWHCLFGSAAHDTGYLHYPDYAPGHWGTAPLYTKEGRGRRVSATCGKRVPLPARPGCPTPLSLGPLPTLYSFSFNFWFWYFPSIALSVAILLLLPSLLASSNDSPALNKDSRFL